MVDTLKGKVIRGYQLLDVIGSGGFGVVYKAHQPVIERDVAIKIIHAKYANLLEFTRRFELEARLIARLESQYIVPVYDFWRDPGGAYLVMRWLRGDNLRTFMEQHSPLSVHFILKVLFQLVSALEIAHQHGVVHRDIKPENIMFDEHQNMYLTDFGIAVDIVRMSDEVIAKTLSLGTPVYMAPEQLMQQNALPQADVYSVGIILYEMLTGKKPFSGNTSEIIKVKQALTPMPSLQEFRSDLPIELDSVLWKATAHSPFARHRRVMDLFTECARVLGYPADFSLFQPLSPTQPPPDQPVASDTARIGQATRIISSHPEAERKNNNAEIATRLLDPIRNPFKGLRPFDEIDAQDFFGRTEAIKRLYNFFQDTNNRFLAVVGPSGSGKSSLVRAGLLSVIRQQSLPRSKDWLIGSMTPGSNPFQSLAEALTQVSFQASPPQNIDLRQSPQQLHEQLSVVLPEDLELFLLIDQFEELFTVSGDDAIAQTFMEMLHHSVTHPESRIRLILTLRADYYDKPLQHQKFGELIRAHTEVVLPLSELALEEIIVEPASLVGLSIQPELKSAILQDLAGQQGALPLLQHALSELYENRDGKQKLELQTYIMLGGISGALSRRAEAIFADMNVGEQDVARQLFLRCVTVASGEPTRKRVLMTELLLNASVERRQTLSHVVERFTRHRLLTLDRDPVTRSPTIDIAHEALISAWSRLQGWIDDSRADLHRYYQLQILSQAWMDADEDPSFLASGARLAEFESLLDTPHIALNPTERAFIKSGVALKQRGVRRLRLAVALLALFSVFAVALAAFALNQQQRALSAQAEALTERDRANITAQVARSRELAANTLSALGRPDVALLLGYHASNIADTFEGRNSLLIALQTAPNLQAYAHGHNGGVRAVVYSADGTWAASSGEDRTIRIWDADDWQLRRIIESEHTATINALAVHDDTIFVASADGTVSRWNVQRGEMENTPFSAHNGIVWDVALHPDGQTAASGSADGTLLLWDTTTGDIIHSITDAHTDAIYALAFSPDGALVVSGGGDNTVRFWDAETGEQLAEDASVHSNWVSALAFSPSGRQVASSGADSQLAFWDVLSLSPQRIIRLASEIWVRGLSYSTTGEMLALAGSDGGLYIWDVISGQMLGEALAIHQNSVWDVATSPRADTFITASGDGMMIAWDLTPPYRPATRAFITTRQALRLALHPTANQMAVALSDGQIQLWDLDSGFIESRLGDHQSAVITLDYSPSGSYISALDVDNRLTLWDAENGQMIHDMVLREVLITPHLAFGTDDETLFITGLGALLRINLADETSPVTPIEIGIDGISAFQLSADGDLLAIGSDTGEIVLVNLADSSSPPTRLRGHEGAVMALAFAEGRGVLVSASRDSTLIIWDYERGQPLFEPLRVHSDWVLDVAIAPDERLMASASRDQTVILWDLTTARPLGYPFAGHRDWVQNVVFHPDGSMLYSAGLDGVIFEWVVSLHDWQSLACQISNRDFRADEWPRYFDEQPASCAR